MLQLSSQLTLVYPQQDLQKNPTGRQPKFIMAFRSSRSWTSWTKLSFEVQQDHVLQTWFVSGPYKAGRKGWKLLKKHPHFQQGSRRSRSFSCRLLSVDGVLSIESIRESHWQLRPDGCFLFLLFLPRVWERKPMTITQQSIDEYVDHYQSAISRF